MLRKTKKNYNADNGYEYLPAHNMTTKECLNKLGQLEDLEQEIGFDLDTLIKAQTQGFYIINGIDEIEKAKLSEWRFNLTKREVHRVQWNKHLSFADYGRTWALTKEELLEN